MSLSGNGLRRRVSSLTDEKRQAHIARYRRYEKIRAERGKCDADVARATGVQHATLSAWKRGDYTPGYSKIIKIAEYLNCPMAAFEYDEPQKVENHDHTETPIMALAMQLAAAEFHIAKCREILGVTQNGGDTN